jgi:Tfp pilus assembly protein PilN
MKIQINLLPLENRPPKWNYSRVILMPTFIVLLIIGGSFGYGEYKYWELDRQLTETRQRYETLVKPEQQMRIAQTRQVAVAERQKILVQLSGSRNSWHGILAYMGTLMPRKVWLTEIGSAQKGVLQMKGSASSYPDLGVFLGKMEKDGTFIEPALLKAEQNEKDSFTKFEITARVREL